MNGEGEECKWKFVIMWSSIIFFVLLQCTNTLCNMQMKLDTLKRLKTCSPKYVIEFCPRIFQEGLRERRQTLEHGVVMSSSLSRIGITSIQLKISKVSLSWWGNGFRWYSFSALVSRYKYSLHFLWDKRKKYLILILGMSYFLFVFFKFLRLIWRDRPTYLCYTIGYTLLARQCIPQTGTSVVLLDFVLG